MSHRFFLTYITLTYMVFCSYAPMYADTKPKNNNEALVGLITGSATGTYVKIGGDLSAVLDGQYGLRILTMLGHGAQRNIKDMLSLDAVNLGLVQSDVLTQIRLTDPNSLALSKISYISKVYNEELHIITTKQSGIRKIADLKHKRVNIGGIGSGSELTAKLVLKFLDIEVFVQNQRNADALEALKSDHIDAMMFVAGKPTAFASSITRQDDLRLVSVPYSNLLAETYHPSILTALDYPTLIQNSPVETISVGAILAVFDDHPTDSKEYLILNDFCKALIENQRDFKNAARHEKWGELNLSEQVPGWRRFKPMKELLFKSTPKNKPLKKVQ